MLTLATVSAASGAAGTEPSLDPLTLAMGLLGGLALFLYGMDKMSQALKEVAGERMRAILARLTRNRLMGAATGAFVTAVIQSSSVTTVLVVGFVTAGLMSLSQSIGVIMGANVGTTITAQIIAFKVTQFALAMIAAGFAGTLLGRSERSRLYAAGLLGLGLIFFGMSVMGDSMSPLRSYGPFLDWMVRMESPLVGILIGAVFTALIQSSSATTGIVIVMASQGLISLPAGIALILGANVGTCVTAGLAAIGKPREALRAAAVHVLFNLAGVLLWAGFVDHLAAAVVAFSPQAPDLTGTARLAAETPRQIANAHTVFNLANTLIFLGFSTQFGRLVERWVPDRPIEHERRVRARYLDRELLSTPALALDRVRLEIIRQGDRVKAMLTQILPALLHGSQQELRTIEDQDDEVDELHGQIVEYLGLISQQPLAEPQRDEFLRLMESANSLENIGDIIETNLVRLGSERLHFGFSISAATEKVIEDFHGEVGKALDNALHAVTQKSELAARRVIDRKGAVNRMAEAAAQHGARRLLADEPNRLEAYRVETDILQNLKRIYYFTKRMARAAAGGAATDSDRSAA